MGTGPAGLPGQADPDRGPQPRGRLPGGQIDEIERGNYRGQLTGGGKARRREPGGGDFRLELLQCKVAFQI